MRQGDWKLVQNFENGIFELYNFKNDMSEQRNELSHFPKIANKLKLVLLDWQKEVGAKFPTPNPNVKK